MTTFKSEKSRYDELFHVLLGEHKMRCRVVTERGVDALRVSTHIFNNEEEVDRLAEAVRGICAGKQGFHPLAGRLHEAVTDIMRNASRDTIYCGPYGHPSANSCRQWEPLRKIRQQVIPVPEP
ncbi:MAG: hypothetical protein R2834_03950 [Rhodothermales bacterium]